MDVSDKPPVSIFVFFYLNVLTESVTVCQILRGQIELVLRAGVF